ncbi:putative hybrid NRPS/PKS enzyme [Clathrospora elynae]|uniref:Putative hybrid NRPS/PKS enzyme n=1 Tax=Clathrospora elynae TaxID=706981 RepID=A0A6A5SGF9_9PLEO|nr:putative hybrid NRPS/PKS enzyme [Clathrospora elynae]
MSPKDKGRPNEPIAVIGSGFRFPGEANTPSKLWDLLREPRDVQSAIPEQRFNPDGFFHPVNDHHGTSNIRHSYFLSEDHRQFDAQFFGIKPVEANSIDPQQRILLEVVYESIEAAGLSMDTLRGSPTAVYVGLMCADYADLLGRDTSYFPTYFATGTARSIISNRISYFFDWRGPSMTIDTACSSSLVAVHQAVQVLRSGESRVAVAAGANLLLGPEQYIAESNLKMLSPDGRSYMWDTRANGYARGEGIASVVLKTLSAAIADGDDIECLIVETGINQDGKTKGITMPSATAQAALIEATYRKAGLDLKKASDRPQYFEAHGTGTPAGDPIEAEAISTAFFKNNTPTCVTDPLYVGSIKTIVGHTEGTAGLAGLLKASLALKHGFIPPNRLFENLAPAVKPFYNNLEIATNAKPWPAVEDGSSRRASLNSFGFGGANAHCILEAYSPEQTEHGKAVPVYTPFMFSAASEKALSTVVASYSEYLKSYPSTNLRALSYTLSSRRNAFPLRVTFSARHVTGLCTKLDMFAEGKGEKPIAPVPVSALPLRVLGVFTGQGAQWAGMASKLINAPAAMKIIDDLERSLSELKDYPPQWSLKAELLADESSSRIAEAALSQPACTAVQIMLVELLRAVGISFSAVVGHSSGEIGAAYAAGYLSASDAIRIAYYRGVHLRNAHGKNGEDGAMIAVGTSYEDAKKVCNLRKFRGKVCVAASNSSTSVTISGDATAIEGVKTVFEDEKRFARVLKVDKACNNLVSPVLFSQAMKYALGESQYDLAVELGPHPALKGPAAQVIQEVLGESIPYTGMLSRNVDDVEAFASGLGYIWATFSNTVINFPGYDRFLNASEPPKVLKGLPTYPWEHQRAFWHESRISRAFRERRTNHELLGTRSPNHSNDQFSWTNYLIPRELSWIPGHKIQGQMVFPAAGYMSTAFEAAREIAVERPMKLIELTDFVINQPLVFDTEDSSVEILISLTDVHHQGSNLTAKFSYYSIANKDPGPMSINASCALQIIFGEADANILQPLPEQEFAMMEVEHERFYSSFANYGYGYTGPFKALTSMERKLGVASGLVQVPEAVPEKRLLIHPAALDAAVQSILLAYCFPGDGRLVSIQLPTDVSRISINPLQALNSASEKSLKFFSFIGRDDGKRIEGDVDLYPADGSNAVLQLEGMHTKPMVPPTEATDAHIFSETVWDSASPNAMVVSAETKENFDFGFVLERVAYYYLRNLTSGTTAKDREDCEWYHKSLFNFADTMLSRVANGTHPYAKTEWINDTYEEIVTIIKSHPQSIDLRIMRAVGDNIISVVRGKTTILEPMMEDNMLNDFYVTGLGMEEYLRKLTATARQIAHRHPAMNVLEIGAGTGGATKSILRDLDEAFASYTYTDISAGFFEKAKEVFKARESKMIYKTLDIEKDVIDQGYEEYSYDLIIASLVLHATSKLDETMSNVRRLLKPGGYLMLLEITDNEQMRFGFIFGGLPGWWLGHEDGRPLSPCIEVPKWDSLLKAHGFSGVDSMAAHKTSEPLPLCVMLGQAVDDRIDFLRDPLASTEEGFNLADITFIGGATAATSGCLSAITNMLRARSNKLTRAGSMVDLVNFDLPFGGTVVSLEDHDEPIFRELDENKLKGMQKLFERSKNVLWVIRGYKHGSSYAKMAVAFARCLLQEMPHVRLQFLDIPPSESLEATLISEYLLRFLVAENWEEQGRLNGLFWSLEPEISYEGGQDLIPRVKLSKSLNNRYNSARRQIIETVDPAVVPITLSFEDGSYTLKSKHGLAPIEPTCGTDIKIRVSYSLLRAVKVRSHGYFYLLLGTNIATGVQIVALSSILSSEVDVPEDLTRPCSLPKNEAIKYLVALFYSLVSFTALRHLGRGDALLVLEPEKSLATIVESTATLRGIQAMFLTAEANPDSHGAWKSLPSRALRRDFDAIVPHQLSRVLCWKHNDWTSAIRKHIPSRTTIETFESYMAIEASHAQSNVILRVSKVFDRALMQLLPVGSTMEVGDTQIIRLTDVHELPSDSSSVTVVDWTTCSTVPIAVEPIDRRPLFRSDKTYWLVGLTGGLGLSLCRWMILRGAKYIVISSRSPKIDPRWMAQFESLEAIVKVYANDVTDRESVRSVHSKIQADMPPVAGVCQGAMVLQDTLFLDLDIPRMEKVLNPKVNGAIHLDEIFQSQKLDFFIMLSSMAAVTGNPGQAAYAAANMFLAGLAAQRRARGEAGSTVNIGAIVGNGYVTRELTLAQQVALQKVGNMWMSEQDFYQIFAEAVVASPPRPGPNPEYCTGLRVYYADEDDKPKFANDPVFSHLMLHRNLSGPLTTSNTAVVSVKTQLLQTTTAEEVYETMRDSFVLKLQVALQMSPDADAVGQTADALGIDSLVAVDLRSWFMKELSVDMPVLKIISGATVGEILQRAQELLDPGMTPALGTELTPERKAALEQAKAAKLSAKVPLPSVESSLPEPRPASVRTEQAPRIPANPKSAPTLSTPRPTGPTVEYTVSVPSRLNTTTSNPTPKVTGPKPGITNSTSQPALMKPAQELSSAVNTALPTATRMTLPTPAHTTKDVHIPAAVLLTPIIIQETDGYMTSSVDLSVSRDDLESGFRSVQSLSTTPSEPDESVLYTKAVSSGYSVSSFDKISPASTKESAIQRTLPMSFGQARFWFLRSYLEDHTTFNVTTSIHLQGSLDGDRLAQAVATIGQRHEALRTRFFTDHNNRPMQAVLECSVLQLERKNASLGRDVLEAYDQLRDHVYDLENGETMRIVLLKLSPLSHQILLGYHHINMDGVSFEIFFSDLEKAYNANPLVNSSVLQYPDFAAKQRQEFADGKWSKELKFWQGQFQTLPPPLPLLPLARSTSRVSLTRYNSNLTSYRVTPELSAQIYDTCKKMKVSPSQFYLTVYKILLTRFVEVDDLCIGVADANRNDLDVQQSLGCYLNLLPVRFDNRATTFSEAVKETKNKAQQAYANSRVPFDILLKELNVPRSSSHSPLFQVFLNYRQGVAEKRTFAACDSEWDAFDGGQIAYDLSLDVVDNAGGDALLRLFSQTALYSARDGEVLMKSFINLLEAFSRNPAARLTRPPLHSKEDAEKGLVAGRGSYLPLEWQGTLVHRIDHIAQIHESSPAVKDGLGNDLTFAQLIQRANVIAAALFDSNIPDGSNVGVFQEPSADWICSLLAIMRVGAVYVPLDPRATTSRVAAIAESCQPALILFDNSTEKQIPEIKSNAKIVNVSRIYSTPRDVPNVSKEDSTMAILYTSGSTGTSKGIEMKHTTFRDHVETVSRRWIASAAGKATLQQSSFSFDMSLVQIFWPLCSGGRIFVAPQSARGDPVAICKIISTEKISITAATPSEYISWVDYGDAESLRKSPWSLAISGGENVTEQMVLAFDKLKMPNFRLMNCYGPTEITFFSHVAEIDVGKDKGGFADFVPWFNVSSYILDSKLNPLPAGVPGEVAIGGMGVASGYYDKKNLTAERFLHDPYASEDFIDLGWTTMHLTGDRGRLTANGALLLEGRIAGDTQIKLRGLRIDLQEIEWSIVQGSEGIIIHAVVSVRQSRETEVELLVGHVEFSPSKTPTNANAFIAKVVSNLPLPQYMRPAMVIPVERIPRTESGKLDRLAVKALPLPQKQQGKTTSGNLSETESRLLKLWRDVLAEEILDSHTVDQESDFFQVGGTSMLLTVLRLRIKETFAIDIPLVQIFDVSTLGRMAAQIHAAIYSSQAVTPGDTQTQFVTPASTSAPVAVLKEAIDWESETAFSASIIPSTVLGSNEPRVVILTGATGFLGKKVLQRLVDTPSIEKIYCIAIRPDYSRTDAMFSSSKVVVYRGDQSLPLLGLPPSEITPILSEADEIIHNGADVSFLKSYTSLRQVNVASTKQLAIWAVEYGLQFHYISTASVANLSGRESYPSVSVRDFKPATDGSNGYIASKWASEIFLENMNREYLMPLVIHRPSSITGPGAPDTDVMGSLFKYSKQMQAIPRAKYIEGWIDLISLDSAASKIVKVVRCGIQDLDVQYVYENGEVQIKSTDMKNSMEEQTGEDFKELSIEEWVRRADILGMNSMVGAFLLGMQDQPLLMTKPERKIEEEDLDNLPECVRVKMGL